MADLQLNKVFKRYGDVETIHGVDLDIKNGEFVVFVGPSGCGKSTLLRMIAGLEEISGGEVSIDGQVVNNKQPSERGIAMVFQSYALYPHMTVRENMSFGLEVAKSPKEYIDQRVNEAAKILKLEELLDRKPKQLSGGQRQRVAIGRTIVREPKVFLFDEPLSNLDAELRVQMRIEISKLHEDLGNTMIYVTHDQVEAMTMADKIVVLRAGNIEQVGSPLELYRHPQNLFVAGFIGSPRMNFLDAVLSATDAVNIDGISPVLLRKPIESKPIGTALTLGIRPEHVRLTDKAEGTIPATATSVEQLGSDSYLYCQLPSGQALTVHHPGQTGARRGDAIHLRLDMDAAHVFLEGGVVLPN